MKKMLKIRNVLHFHLRKMKTFIFSKCEALWLVITDLAFMLLKINITLDA